VLVILAQRLTQGLLGVVTVIFLVSFSTLSEQGWYYASVSIVAFSTLFDLGQSVVITQQAAKLSFGDKPLSSDRIEIIQLIGRWRLFYVKATVLYAFFALATGFWLLSFHDHDLKMIYGIAVWFILNVLTALNFITTPILAAIEGSGGLNELYTVRLFQNAVGAIATWVAIVYVGPLWAPLAMPFAIFAIGSFWLFLRFRPMVFAFFMASVSTHSQTIIQLRRHVAITWVSGYLLAQIATPILFRLSSPAEAGRMGLSLTIINMIAVFSQSSIAHKVPLMAGAVERKQWSIFDDVFRKSFRQSLFIFFVLSFFVLSVRFIVEWTDYSSRLMNIFPFFLLLMGVFCTFLINVFASKLRSYQKEPLVIIIASAASALLISYLIIAEGYGSYGVSVAFFSIQCCVAFPLSWWEFIKHDKALRASC
jgi:hypothetical protein